LPGCESSAASRSGRGICRSGSLLFLNFDPPARRHFSRDFPYAIIFMEKPEHVWIVAVMHMKRRPGYWRGRLGGSI
jgi:hypothetical protein